MVVTQTT